VIRPDVKVSSPQIVFSISDCLYNCQHFPLIDRHDLFFRPKDLLMKAIGWPSCIRTAPTPVRDASVSTTNYLLKSCRANTGALVINFFKSVNACVAF